VVPIDKPADMNVIIGQAVASGIRCKRDGRGSGSW
jgi:hypothetical protein